jgi:isocitrate dehydrogenase
MIKKHLITVAYGDGIGPEIMQASLDILEAAGAHIEVEVVKIGEKIYLAGNKTGMEEGALASLQKSKVFFKAPITTPQGGGYRSLNVTIRGKLGLYANVRPCISYAPFIQTKHPNMDVVIVRENEEDLYTGIEYRQTPDVTCATKLISRSGSERICRYAFEYARRFGRKKVTCFTKDNILKLTDGLFHRVFNEIAQEYPDIDHEHWIVDIGSAKLADTPENFDLIVLPNLYGDILSDVAAQISGSVGLAGSANIGEVGAMFEAIHGSAPRRAGQNVANPSGLILASVLMLVHICQPECAARIHNSWLKTIEEGIHTYDIYTEERSREKVGTKEFAQAVIKRLGKKPESLKAVEYTSSPRESTSIHHGMKVHSEKRELVGCDLYLYSHERIDTLVKKAKEVAAPFTLTLITNRGVEVWPHKAEETILVDQFRLRFEAHGPITPLAISKLYADLITANLDIIKTENLYTFNNIKTYSHVT